MSSIFTTVINKPSHSSVEPSIAGEDKAEGANLTVVTLDGRADLNGETPAGIPEADMGLDLEAEAELPAPTSTLKKRGRPSLSASVTPAKSVASRTPRSTKSAAAPRSAGRSTGKRKAAEAEAEPESEPQSENEPEPVPEPVPEPTPARKRGRPARSAGSAPSARLVAKAAKKPARGRPKSTVSITGYCL